MACRSRNRPSKIISKSPPSLSLADRLKMEEGLEKEDKELLEEVQHSQHVVNTTDTVFILKTPAGVLSYKADEYSSYNDFIRVIFEMLLAFNGSEIDPLLKKVYQHAMEAYEAGYFDDDDDDDDDEIGHSLQNAQSEKVKFEEATKFISNLPKTEKLNLKLLHHELFDKSNIKRTLSKFPELPSNKIDAIINNNATFTLPFDKATELYVQLRMMGIILTIKPNTTKTNTIKKSAAKSTVKQKRASTKTTTKAGKADKKLPTGNETLAKNDGLI